MAFELKKGMIAVATSYSGGNYNFEKLDEYIEQSSLQITPDQMQDLDSYVNANGKLKRNTMPYSRSKIEGNIKAWKDDSIIEKVMKMLERATKVPDGISAENKVRIRFYNPKKRDYSYAWAYFPDIAYNVYGTYKGAPMYTPTRIAFITYGEKVN